MPALRIWNGAFADTQSRFPLPLPALLPEAAKPEVQPLGGSADLCEVPQSIHVQVHIRTYKEETIPLHTFYAFDTQIV